MLNSKVRGCKWVWRINLTESKLVSFITISLYARLLVQTAELDLGPLCSLFLHAGIQPNEAC